MIIRRGRKLHIGVTTYEFVEASAEIEFDTNDLPDGATVEDWADEELTRLLAKEVEEAAAVTTRSNSFIDQYRYTETASKEK